MTRGTVFLFFLAVLAAMAPSVLEVHDAATENDGTKRNAIAAYVLIVAFLAIACLKAR